MENWTRFIQCSSKRRLFSNMNSKDIRQQFIDFFKDKQHAFIRSSPVVPQDDPTLLFINAGMNQFKPVFLGQAEPQALRAVNTQKCIRVSGKHNDLEEVGVDDYHHTFFEMLGNWSFGDYYKKEAITWAWELLTDVWKIDKSRLWVTIFQDDDEAGELWKKYTDIDPNRVLKFGHKDNFWEMGETGPCGPCSEIHYYSGDDPDSQIPEGVNRDDDYREIWNLVFIQYNRIEDGSLTDLPQKHVDTGAGFERIVAVLNDVKSNYETDLFQPIISKIVELTGKSLDFKDGIPHRVIADHVRMLSFSIADGALPGNEGRGYVLRRVLRRAARFGRLLDMHEPFIYQLVDTLISVMGTAFPEIRDKKSHIKKVLKAEETSFGDTLDRGLDIFAKINENKKAGDQISGDDAFKLYDTFGFPLDLTELMARENGLTVDQTRFEVCMLEQKNRARAAGKFDRADDTLPWTEVSTGPVNEFLGYTETTSLSEIRKYRIVQFQVEIILDKTPFYAEQGGQIGDTGTLSSDGLEIAVVNTQKYADDIVHIGIVKTGSLAGVKKVSASIDNGRRQKIRSNHTATHLMHKALKTVLGEHVHQAGSLVAPDRLRFDVTHYERITAAEITKVETIVNDVIRQNIVVDITIKSYDEALQGGATALFGEKYGDEVRVINVTDFSQELCGGTHVNRTGDIGMFKIISESALAAGIRRLEAITGAAAFDFLISHDEILNEARDQLKCSVEDINERIKNLLTERRQMEKELSSLREGDQSSVVAELVQKAESIDDIRLVVIRLDNAGDLKKLGDTFRKSAGKNGIALVGTVTNNKPMVLCAVTDDLTSKINAGESVREVGSQMGGGGGGKPHLATAGGKDADKLDAALKFGTEFIKNKLKL